MNDRICFYAKPFPEIKSYFDMIDTTVEYGLKNIEGFNILDFQMPDKGKAEKIREYADKRGVKFVCFSVYTNLVGEDSKEQIKHLKEYADVASILGSPYLHHTIAGDFSNPEKTVPHKEEYFQKGVLAVREIYDYCETLGIRAIYEEQGFVFNGIDGYKRFLEEVQRNVGVLADFANICQSGDKIEDFIEEFSDKIVHAHIKDVALNNDRGNTGLPTLCGTYMHETPVGKGDVNIRKATELLKEKGFNGYFGLEYGTTDNNRENVESSLRYIDSLL